MDENTDKNKIIEDNEDNEEYDFTYNFINTPWDDRDNKSKICVIALLVTIFVTTVACVSYSLSLHYREFKFGKSVGSTEINCQFKKMDEYRFVARIHSLSTKELLCVGAVITSTSVLANEVCIKSGPIRLHLGGLTDPRCKKGFSVDMIDYIYHNGVISKKLVLLTSSNNIAECSDVIRIGIHLEWDSPGYIIGRPLHSGKSLTRQAISFVGKGNCTHLTIMNRHLNIKNTICVKKLVQCPTRAGDLLVQNGQLFGLASTSVHYKDRNKLAYFADLDYIHRALKDLDVDVGNKE